MNAAKYAAGYLDRLKSLVDTLDLNCFQKMVELILDAYHRKARIFVMGNGGSGATASHLACDINKGCCFDLPGKFKVICLNDNVPTMLALANDVSYNVVFVEQLKNFLDPGDLVIGISGSGNSENVLRAVQYASSQKARSIGLCGFGGGKLAEMADLAFVVESRDMQQVEDAHLIVAHMLMQSLYAMLHGADNMCTCAGSGQRAHHQ